MCFSQGTKGPPPASSPRYGRHAARGLFLTDRPTPCDHSMPSRDLIERVRKALGDRYTVITAVGRGGHASIFGAYDQQGQKVAIKVLHPELAVSVAVDRFLREIRYASQLDHPHIARTIDSGQSDYLLWCVMPYIPGETLRQVLRRETHLTIARAVRVACEVLDALGHAH